MLNDMTMVNDIFAKYINLTKQKWKRIPLLDRWLISELIPPFLFAVSSFTTISLTLGAMFELVREIVEKRLSRFVFEIAWLPGPFFSNGCTIGNFTYI